MLEVENTYPEVEVESFLQAHEGKLTEREKDIIRLRCGLLDGKICSSSEVALIMGITTERVRFLESGIVRKCGGSGTARHKRNHE